MSVFDGPEKPIYIGMTDCIERTGYCEVISRPCSCEKGFVKEAHIGCKIYGKIRALVRCRMACRHYQNNNAHHKEKD